ncbi:hypothetical protein KAR91_73265 [Candidatus Pacearchaeota archaeon]|nr:hypothetical protein [Candidatus Pacearchaeota archaeon]
MAKKSNTFLSKINLSILAAIFTMIGSVFVTYYKVDQLVDGQEIIKENQVEMHSDIDKLKIQVKDGDHALDLKIKDETIARQKVEIEFYKNK